MSDIPSQRREIMLEGNLQKLLTFELGNFLPKSLLALASGTLNDPKLLVLGPGNYEEVMALQQAIFLRTRGHEFPMITTHTIDRVDARTDTPSINWLVPHVMDIDGYPDSVLKFANMLKPELILYRHPYIGGFRGQGRFIEFVDQLAGMSPSFYFSARSDDLPYALIAGEDRENLGLVLGNIQHVPNSYEDWVFAKDELMPTDV